MDKAEIIAALWRDLLEKDDRTSPAEYPDMALITRDEFEAAILAALSSPAQASAPEPSDLAEKDYGTPIFDAVWEAIKQWDLDRGDYPGATSNRSSYAGATGTDVQTILNVVNPFVTAARREGLREAAQVAKAHKGAAKRKRAENMGLRNSMRFASDEARAEIFAEERGEDIAAEIIEREIRALAAEREKAAELQELLKSEADLRERIAEAIWNADGEGLANERDDCDLTIEDLGESDRFCASANPGLQTGDKRA
jgi:hypothetical protein